MANGRLCGSVHLPTEPGIVLRWGRMGVRLVFTYAASAAVGVFLRGFASAVTGFAFAKPVLDIFDTAYQVHDLLPCYG